LYKNDYGKIARFVVFVVRAYLDKQSLLTSVPFHERSCSRFEETGKFQKSSQQHNTAITAAMQITTARKITENQFQAG